MLFHSTTFLALFALVFCAYWLLGHRAQNRLLLAASYVFYAYADYRFSLLIMASGTLNYFCAIAIEGAGGGRRGRPDVARLILTMTVAVNLLPLALLKYPTLLADTLNPALSLIGLGWRLPDIGAINPVGISFFTFQGLSYVIDVYRGQTRAHHGGLQAFVDFQLFIAFFAQLIAGPIERSWHLLSQVVSVRRARPADLALGCWLFAVGLALKVGIADPMSALVERTFADLAAHGLGSIYIGTLGFAVQIFCDFAGYSLMARGLGLLLGFGLAVNFRQPYFAASFSDFWRRWHITLSTWIRDYVYIPLGGSRGTELRTAVNILAAMALCGLWHGASWAFVLWGVLHGVLLALERWGRRLLGGRVPPRPARVIYSMVVFHGVLAGWFLFRIGDLPAAIRAVQGVSVERAWLAGLTPTWATIWPFVAFALFLVLHEWKAWRTDGDVAPWTLAPVHRAALYALLAVLILSSGGSVNVPFIYFQF